MNDESEHRGNPGSSETVDPEPEVGRGRKASSPFVPLKGSSSLERLRDRVETAAHELKQLREENQALATRIQELESNPRAEEQGTLVSFDQDPELLRRKISAFIDAIDEYLNEERRPT